MGKHALRRFYVASIAVVMGVSLYPLYMGAQILVAVITDGGVDASNYPQYVIPYTPICVALLLCTLLLPLVRRLAGRFSLLVLSTVGVAAFLACELALENVLVFAGDTTNNVAGWQAFMCVATPEVQKSLATTILSEYSPVFKLHFYLISLLIILAALNTLHGLSVIAVGHKEKRRPLFAQLAALCVFVGLCIWACFTAFYRTGTLTISPLSAVLTAGFFVVFGLTAAIYISSLFYGKGTALTIVLPTGVSVATCLLMYIGEMVMMDGQLYRFGTGFFYEPLGPVPFAPADVVVLFASGAVAFLFLKLLNRHSRQQERPIHTN